MVSYGAVRTDRNMSEFVRASAESVALDILNERCAEQGKSGPEVLAAIKREIDSGTDPELAIAKLDNEGALP